MRSHANVCPRKPADWRRFVGDEVEVTLREAFQNRKKWRGVLAAGDGDNAWRLVLPDDKPLSRTAAKKLAKAAEPAVAAQQRLVMVRAVVVDTRSLA